VLGEHEVPGIDDAAEPLSGGDNRRDDSAPAVGIAVAILIAFPVWVLLAWVIRGISLLRAAQ
jgi:hypothetical protein